MFVRALRSLLGDKLWSRDQKKTQLLVSLGKESESSITKVNNDLDLFYTQVAQSLKNTFGYISKNRLVDYL